MVPSEAMPDFIQQAGKGTLNYWAIEGFRTVLFRGGGVSDIGLHLAVLSLFGAVMTLLASALFTRSLRR